MFLDWLYSTEEWKGWGWNVLTWVFIAMQCINILQGWAVVRQFHRIGRLRSGASVSVPLFAFAANVFLTFLVYGIAVCSLAAVLNGTLGCLYLAVVFRLARYRRFSPVDWMMLGAVPIVIVAMCVTSHRGVLLAVLMGIGILPLVHQTLIVHRARSIGAIEPRFLLVFAASSTFLGMYGFAIGDLVLEIVNPIAAAVQCVTIALWLSYRRHPFDMTP